MQRMIVATLAVGLSAQSLAAPCPVDTVGFNGACRTHGFFDALVGDGVLRVDGSSDDDGKRVVLTLLHPSGAEVLTIDATPAGPAWDGPVVGPHRVVQRWARFFSEPAGTVVETTSEGNAGLDGWDEVSTTTTWSDPNTGVRCDDASCEPVSGPGAGALPAVKRRAALATSTRSSGACVDTGAGAIGQPADATAGTPGGSQCATSYSHIMGVDGAYMFEILWWLGQECDAGNEVTWAVSRKIMCTWFDHPTSCTDFYVYETTAQCGLEQVGFYTTCDCPDEIPEWT